MPERDLQAAMEEFQRCIEQRDVDGAAAVLDEEYALVLVHPEEAVVDRARWLDILPRYVVHEYEAHAQVAHLDESCASVLQRVSMRATVLGADRSGTFILSDTWLRRRDGWRIWRRHSTPLTAARMPGRA